MIDLDNISFGYKNKPMLFKELSLKLPLGGIYGLLGKNGAGKSTMLKLLSGLIFPEEGTITVDNHSPGDRLPSFMREIYLVTEEFDLPSITVKRLAELHKPFYPRFDNERFFAYLEEFKLASNEKLSSLSYGQKKKFLLSFGLATDCKLLILDEPTNGLDIPSKSQFRKVVASAIHEERSFIISTHQVKDVENLIDSIIIIDEGSIALYEDYSHIAQKLVFEKRMNVTDKTEMIYTEPGLGGYSVVRKNNDEEETNINLELLFNAVINERDNISKAFKND